MSLEPQLDIRVTLLAGLSEGQRSIAHVVIVLAVLLAVGLVYLIRRMRRRGESREKHRTPE
jgi:hypothetical protein